jgi:hypothetical protein
LELLDEITQLKFDNNLPSGVGGVTRNQLISSYRIAKGVSYVPKSMPDALKWTNDDDYKIEDLFEEAEWHIIETSKQKKNKTDSKSADKAKEKGNRTNIGRYVPAHGTKLLVEVSSLQCTPFGHKRVNHPFDSTSSVQPGSKQQKMSNILLTSLMVGPKGFQWNGNTYSCAFDSLFTILTHIMFQDTACWSELVSDANENMKLFCCTFDGVDPDSTQMEQARDIMQNNLSDKFPNVFTTSTKGNDIIELCEYMLSPTESLTIWSLYCN